MRRSAQVFAPLLASTAALLLTGCGPEMQRCVDQQNHVVDPAFCKNLPAPQQQAAQQQAQQHQGGGVSPIVPLLLYHYYYGGSGGYGIGSTATGGGYSPAAGHSYSMTSGTSRGGFGSSFSSHGGGEGE